ncbi:ABC transporter permease [Arthrobacter sp. A5]|uniref:ABC transporter permease n=1 Tax=Arthrobacter sp. A5 TaxID=576926 RepID=UPI003DA7AFC0
MGAVVRLAMVQARRDRWILAVWILGIAGLGFVTSIAVAGQFGNEDERAAIISVAAASPAFLFLRGLPDGTGIGAVVFFQVYSSTAVLAGLMSTFLVVRHTRADEELGRSELIGSAPVPRVAPLAATLLVGACANLVLAGSVTAGFAAAGLPASGSLVAGAAVGAVGLFFVAAAAVVAQVMPSGRSANGVAAGLIGAAYLVRGIGAALGTPDADLMHVKAAWPSLFSPIGWGQRSRPFSSADPVPLLVLAAAALVLAAAAVLVRNRRDLGASVLHDRYGKERAGAGGASFVGLAWRLQRSTLAGWCLAAATIGAVAGGLAPLVRDALAGNPSLKELIGRLVPGGQADVVDLLTTALLGIAGVLAAAAGIQAVLRLRAEEAEGRAELLLAVPASRARWLAGTLAIAALSVTAVATTAGTAAAVGLGLSGAGNSQGGLIVAAALAHVPAAAVFPAVTSLAFAVVPRLSSALAWGFLAVGLILGQFGELLGLPLWLQDMSPFRHSSAMPAEPFDPDGALTLTVSALAGAALAAFLIRRRDLTA